MKPDMIGAVAAAMLASGAVPAAAHPLFMDASPRRGAVVAAAPREIRVTFSEAVLAQGSSFQLNDAAGKPMKTGALARDAQDDKTLVLPVAGALPPGAYTVQWRVAAAGHTTVPGRYRFEIRR